MTHVQFLQDFVDTYVADPSRRAVTEIGACMYLAESGNKCAIGKHIIEGEYHRNCEGENCEMVIKNYPNMFPDWIKKLSMEFLRDVQLLHDDLRNIYWKDNKLTDKGKTRLSELEILAQSLDKWPAIARN